MPKYHAETKPAGTLEVFVSKIWNPNSSMGRPNSTNLFSYTLIVSLYAYKDFIY